MSNTTYCIENTKGNRFYFYNRHGGIYYRTAEGGSDYDESMIINQVDRDFYITIDPSDTIYLVCTSRERGMLLFIYSNYSWKFDQVLKPSSSNNIQVLYLGIQNGIIHILYLKRKPYEGSGSIVHLYRASTENYWHKSGVTDIVGQVFDNRISILATNEMLHMISASYRDKGYQITDSSMDFDHNIWSSRTVTSLTAGNMSLQALEDDSKLYLLCYSYEKGKFYSDYFICENLRSPKFEFASHSEKEIDLGKDYQVLLHIKQQQPHIILASNGLYQEFMISPDEEWQLSKEGPIESGEPIHNLCHIRCSTNTHATAKSYICQFNSEQNFATILPYGLDDAESIKHNETEPNQSVYTEKPALNHELLNLINEVKVLTENIKELNEKMKKEPAAIEKRESQSERIIRSKPKNNSNFRERFMQQSQMRDSAIILDNEYESKQAFQPPKENEADPVAAEKRKRPVIKLFNGFLKK